MAIVVNKTSVKDSPPSCNYVLKMSSSNRTEKSVYINWTLTSHLTGSGYWFGYPLTAKVFAHGYSQQKEIKGTEMWKGTANHSISGGFYVKNINAETNSLGTGLMVIGHAKDYPDAGNCCTLDGKEGTGSNLSIPKYNERSLLSINDTSTYLGGELIITNKSMLKDNYHVVVAKNGNKSYTFYSAERKLQGGQAKIIFFKNVFDSWLDTKSSSIPIVIEVTTYSASGVKQGVNSVTIQLHNKKSTLSNVTKSVNVNNYLYFDINKFQSGCYFVAELISGNNKTSRTVTGNDKFYLDTSFANWVGSTSTNLIITLKLYSYTQGGTYLGEDSQNFTFNLTESVCKPSPPTLSLKELTDEGALINIVDSVAQYGSYLNKTDLSVDSGTISRENDIITSVCDPYEENSVTITARATDSRGYKSDITNFSYKPELTKFRLYINNKWEKGIPFIYINSKWEKAIGYNYINQKWNK